MAVLSYHTVIAAAEIGSKVYATVTAEKNGVVYCAEEPDVYSIADYCCAVLGSSSMSDSLKTLCADTLNYGAAAQTHFNVNPGKLCNADLTNAQKARSVGDVTLTACSATAAQTLKDLCRAMMNFSEAARRHFG